MPENPQSDTATVTLRLKGGMKKLVVPKDIAGNKDAIVHLLQQKHPELLEGTPYAAQQDEPPPPSQPAKMEPAGFMKGLGMGLNPMHSAPEGTPVPQGMSETNQFVQNMLNMPEIAARRQSGDKAGALGESIGTGIGLMGPELLKGMGGLLRTGTKLGEGLEAGSRSAALKRAPGTKRALGGGIKEARIAEKYIQPIREAIDKRFEPLHKALEKHIVPLNNAAQQAIRRIADMEPEAAKEISDLFRETGQSVRKTGGSMASDQRIATKRLGPGVRRVAKTGTSSTDVNTVKKNVLSVRSALDYREADKLVSRLRALGAEGSETLKTLANEVDKELDTVAKTAGLYDKREELKGLYGEMIAHRNSILDSIKKKSPILAGLREKYGMVRQMTGEPTLRPGKEEVKRGEDLLQKVKGGSQARLTAGRAAGKAGSLGRAANLPRPYGAYQSGQAEQPSGVSGSYQQGTSHVPQTGNYQLHKGEAVIPAELNHPVLRAFLNLINPMGPIGEQYSKNTDAMTPAPMPPTVTPDFARSLMAKSGNRTGIM